MERHLTSNIANKNHSHYHQGVIICVCNNVSEQEIASAVAGGCRSFSKLQDELGVGKACGTCLCSARECFAEQKAAAQAACKGQGPSTLVARLFAPRESRLR